MNAHSKNYHGLERVDRAAYLISGFINQALDQREEEELDQWILADEANMKLFEHLTDDEHAYEFLSFMEERNVEDKLAATKLKIHFRRTGNRRRVMRYAAAACFIGITGIAIFYAVKPAVKAVDDHPLMGVLEPDIEPATEQASLRMEDGSLIVLDRNRDTVINERLSIRGGEVVYANRPGDSLVYHEIFIPRNRFYKLQLPDGSKVWLNASSSIRYPVMFNGTERRVRVTGETYFEVAKDVTKPFIVETARYDVQALGTKFDINDYPDDSLLRTTLVEGSVRVTGEGFQRLMKPSQQLTLGLKNEVLLKSLDTEPIIAWTRNEFSFRDAPIREVMRQVERWYNVKVIYRDRVTTHINGIARRDLPLSKLLHTIEQMGSVSFETDQDQITVKNQR